MAMQRSKQMMILGTAVFALGTGAAVLALGGGSDGTSMPEVQATTSTTIAKGTVIVPSGALPAPASFKIPEGKQAVAVQLPFVAGLAGYAKPGDHVNVYATVEKGKAPVPDLPASTVKLVVPNAEVLAVTGTAPGTGAGNADYLLAMDANQAEQVIFLARFESMWMTLVPEGQPDATTSGRTYGNAL